MLKIVTAAQT